ncbi:MAG: glycosyltransferase family 39 protein [Patescibacteria group bacterium]|nr:glycosyltransferase family 39 protein [Patescibacteria group bacterium]
MIKKITKNIPFLRLKKWRISLLLILIVFVASFFRFANYSNRWILNPDQAWAGVIALQETREGNFPLIGFPSSAGPFNFGPIYFWLTAAFDILPFGAVGPWLGFTLLSTLAVFAFYYFGKVTFDQTFALIISAVAAFSVSLVVQAPDMLNTVLVAYLATLSFLMVGLFLKKQKLIYGYLLGIGVGLAINSHFQALGLLTLLPLAVLINDLNWKKKFLSGIIIFLGLLTAFVPLLTFDFSHNGVWHNSVLDYYLHGQDKFYVPIRWLTEIRDFWPHLFGIVTINIAQAGYTIIFLIFVACLLSFKKKIPLPKVWWVFCLSLILQILLIRYYKGPRSPEYFFFVYPFIIFFTAWAIWVFVKVRKIIGFTLLSLVLLISGYSNLKIINNPFGQAPFIFSIKAEMAKSGIDNVNFYTTSPARNMFSIPLFYLYDWEGKISTSGFKIGACENLALKDEKTGQIREACPKAKILIDKGKYKVYDLNGLSEEEITNLGFINLTRNNLYNWIYTNYEN